MAAIESEEMKVAVLKLSLTDRVDSVILEPTPGRAWQYSNEGKLIAKDKETFLLEAKAKNTRYAACTQKLTDEGVWVCVIMDKGVAVFEKEVEIG